MNFKQIKNTCVSTILVIALRRITGRFMIKGARLVDGYSYNGRARVKLSFKQVGFSTESFRETILKTGTRKGRRREGRSYIIAHRFSFLLKCDVNPLDKELLNPFIIYYCEK